jgi:hypothetical protein
MWSGIDWSKFMKLQVPTDLFLGCYFGLHFKILLTADASPSPSPSTHLSETFKWFIKFPSIKLQAYLTNLKNLQPEPPTSFFQVKQGDEILRWTISICGYAFSLG